MSCIRSALDALQLKKRRKKNQIENKYAHVYTSLANCLFLSFPFFFQSADVINVILSPFNRIFPKGVPFSTSSLPSALFTGISTASSMTTFMNSSNPTILPLILMPICSNNHIVTGVCCCKKLNMQFIGGTMALVLTLFDIPSLLFFALYPSCVP